MKSRKRRRTIYEITGKQIAVTLFIAIFALTLVFFIGVYVGKNAIKVALNDQVTAGTSSISEEFKETIKSVFRKNPSIAKERTEEQKTSTETILKKPNIFSSEARLNKNLEQTNITASNIKSEKKVVQNLTMSEENDESTKTKADEKRYAVKIGTFTAYENAKRLFDLLKNSGYSPQIKTESSKEGNFYHIVVGEFDSIEKAKEYGNIMREKLDYINGYVIKEVSK